MTPRIRISEPHSGIIAYYEGREDGHRYSDGPNWVDDGALSLGIASYAVVSGDEALVYDTHVAPDRATLIRRDLAARGVSRFTVVLSHYHLDHIAGTDVFSDCPVIATERTAAHLRAGHAAIEAGTHSGPPGIAPLVHPTRTYSGRMSLTVGTRSVELIEADIHSDDATVLWLSDQRILLAGDTVEDCVTYVAEPENLDRHVPELDRLAAFAPRHVLPNHGDEEVIAAGGYGIEVLAATQDYIRWLLAGEQPRKELREVLAPWLADGTLHYFSGYEAVHAQNVARVRAVRGGADD